VSWSPFALVTLYSSFINPDHITPLASTFPAVFAKSSTVWSTLFFIFSNKNIKSKISSSFYYSLDRNNIDNNNIPLERLNKIDSNPERIMNIDEF